MDRLQSDFDKRIFSNYAPPVIIPKVYGFEVNDVDEALDYLLYHEGWHAGCVLSLARHL
jgi:hypothetical protein